jgi:aerobic carbon-monoxide dehydrogenase small subunit
MSEQMVHMEFEVNGVKISQTARGGRRLLDFLREDLHLTGSKEGCGEGECGTCTVLLDGHSVLACLTPMERVIGCSVVTIEGIGTQQSLHPVQRALLEEGGVQCGMCTPGMVMSAVALLQENPHPSRDEIIAGITGNLCRCTGYKKIIQAIEIAAVEMQGANSSIPVPVESAR